MTERVDPKRDYWDWVKFSQEEIEIGICTPMEMARLRVIIDRLVAKNAQLREVCRILVAQWETRYRMKNAALWEQELYAQARAALEIKE